ncbi:MAG: rhamnulokinase [Lachnospiraceae bacterium]|nr:rhamnulokinase [Lachnospiraceae bacterium]
METKYHLAIDIGASSGRHILGCIRDSKLILEEVYRFDNGMDESDGTLYWDVDRLFAEVTEGMRRCREIGKIPKTVAVDTWGVDYVLLDKDDNMIGKAIGYRDHRTEGMDGEVYKVIPEDELYHRTGIQKAIYNTVFQLMADKLCPEDKLSKAETLLMIPDYFNFRLTGKKMQEYSEASTSGLLDPAGRDWDRDLIRMLGYPQKIFQEISMPGTIVGRLSEEVRGLVGYDCNVVLAPSHDTASAVLAVPSNDGRTCYISSGTWSLMGVELDAPDCSEKSRLADITNEGGYGGKITYLTNIMGLWMIQSIRNSLAPDMSYSKLCSLASEETIKSIVDCRDPAFLSPKDMAEEVRKQCALTGQEVPETLPALAAVVYNSLAKCYADRLSLIEEMTGCRYDRIHIIGGGSNAAYLNELTAKYTKRTVIAGPGEATATGNILSQMIADGVFETVREARKCVMDSFEVSVFEPVS